MKALVVVGYCLQVNSSANLCHLQYINGLIDLGYEVDLLTVSPDGLKIDSSIQLPNVSHVFEYKAALYERLGHMKSRHMTVDSHKTITESEKREVKTNWKSRARDWIRNLYGPHRIDAGWLLRAQRFASEKNYNITLSLSSPPASHKLTALLIKRGRIHTDKWIQIWEDPWYGEMFGYSNVKKNMFWREEARILESAEAVCYVSPLTMRYQKELFPEFANKMKWQPLPSYYFDPKPQSFENLHYGYFGDYATYFRNLAPFYEAACEMKIPVTICGNSDAMLPSNDYIDVHARMPLSALREYEDKTNVLVFLCNHSRGQIPGKLYQYSATNKMIIFILDGTEDEINVLQRYFSQFNRYVFCRNNKESIMEAIRFVEKKNIGENYHTALDAFTPKRIVSKIINRE